ncbi:hypothetical protein [Psychrobacillus vulpis]|uniref:Uncharacterized protein n=1 Tax=Psychrobacillus vulpis TaxID=2325572 RepID=A0A544TQJ1_9BACI|nr:hypothetical protein [Psychrobacillus vulpis]TQR19714.1 hypothetical protein FG384_10875 [Psychrobacillus vulpis]
MKVLDCGNDDTMFQSLREISGINKHEFLKMFNQFDLDEFYESNPNYHELAYKLFLDKITEMSKYSSFEWDKTCWFHLTRTIPSTQFEDGLLPFGENLDYIWDLLFSLQNGFISKGEWSDFRQLLESNSSIDSAFLYRHKLKYKDLWGPYAMLIREAAFHFEDLGNHNYLGVPEIIRDICNPFQEKYDFNLLEAYKNATAPCIVKFESPFSEVLDLGTVVNFLYHKHNNLKLYDGCNSTFDGKGELIPSSSIIKIEYL